MDITKRHKATNQDSRFPRALKGFKDLENHIKSNSFNVPLIGINEGFFGFFFKAEYHKEREWAEKFLFSATEIARIVFELANNNGKSVAITYDGLVHETEGKVEEKISSFGYLKMISYIYALTRSEVLKNEIKKADFWDDTTYFWKSYIKGASIEDINSILKDKEDIFLKTMDSYGKEMQKYIMYYELKCFAAVINGNEEEFNKYLQEGLEKHYEFYCEHHMFLDEDMNGQNDSDSWVSMPLLALSCLAHDLGLKVGVESEYIPKWIIEKDFQYDLKKII